MMKIFKINLLFIPMFVIGCSKGSNLSSTAISSSMTTSADLSSSQKTISSSSESLTSSSSSKLFEATINLSNTQFGSIFSSGTQFDNDKQKQNLLEFMNNQIDKSDFIESIECENCKSFFADENDSKTSFLTIGSQNSGGSFKVNFNYLIKSISVTAQAYYKYYYDGSTGSYVYNVDTNAVLQIEKNEYSLSSEQGKASKPSTNIYSYDISSQSTSIKSLNLSKHRVFISNVKIYYYL